MTSTATASERLARSAARLPPPGYPAELERDLAGGGRHRRPTSARCAPTTSTARVAFIAGALRADPLSAAAVLLARGEPRGRRPAARRSITTTGWPSARWSAGRRARRSSASAATRGSTAPTRRSAPSSSTDAWQGRGLGTELMRSLGAAAARASGIRTLVGTSLGENQRIHAWARRFGFDVHTEPNSGGQVASRSISARCLPEAARRRRATRRQAVEHLRLRVRRLPPQRALPACRGRATSCAASGRPSERSFDCTQWSASSVSRCSPMRSCAARSRRIRRAAASGARSATGSSA